MYGLFYDPTFIILIPAIIFTFIAQGSVRSAYSRFAQVPNAGGYSGAQAAKIILDANGLSSIPIYSIGGELTDHYDPGKRTMSLSANVFNDRSISSIAIAAHESGHAIQHAKGYAPLKIRNALARPVNVVSHLAWPLLILGVIIAGAGYVTQGNLMFDIGIIAFLGVVAFQLVTLPVELDASKRAMEQLVAHGILYPEEAPSAKKVLRAAAMTYIAALAVALANVLRLLILRGRN